MILVDTSVWIDHLHRSDALLIDYLGRDDVGSHPFVIEELGLGSIKDRPAVLGALAALRQFRAVSHAEVMALTDAHRLWGRGLSAVDAHILGSVLIEPGAQLWTRDKRLRQAARDAGAGVIDS